LIIPNKYLSFLLLLQICALLCTAQTKIITVLKDELAAAKTITEEQAAIFALCEQGYNMHPDTLLSYSKNAMNAAVAAGNLHDMVRASYYQCIAYTTKGMIDSSLEIAISCEKTLTTKVNDPDLLGNILNQKGRCFMRKNQYNDAIDMGYKVVNIAEKTGDILLQVKGKTLIGWAYLEMAQSGNALSWHLKAVHTTTDTLLLEKYGIIFANLALNYINIGMEDSAFYYINKAIGASRKHENLFALSNSLAIQSQLFIRTGTPANAESSLKEVVAIRKLIGDPFYVVSDMSQLGLYYAHYGAPEKGIAVCKEGIEIAKRYKLDSKLIFLYSSLGENYKTLKDSAGYAAVLERIIQLKDSVFQKNSAQALAEIQAKYELEKKENFIIRQNLEISRQRYFLYSLLILAVFSALVAWFLFKANNKRQQIKIIRMQEEEKQQSALAVIKAGETERKRIAADLHDNLGAYAASIASNLDNIFLQEKNAEQQNVLQELRNNSAAIVSQLIDTIWVLKKDNLSLTAISDRLKVFIQRMQPGYPNIRFDVFENISSDVLMSASRAFHLYRIVQEAIINALKKNNIQNIRVLIESSSGWKIIISADGAGVDKENKPASPGGFNNMKERSAEWGFKIDWVPNDPKGINIIIQPTTN
jgi:signal transduction histidine kinase